MVESLGVIFQIFGEATTSNSTRSSATLQSIKYVSNGSFVSLTSVLETGVPLRCPFDFLNVEDIHLTSYLIISSLTAASEMRELNWLPAFLAIVFLAAGQSDLNT